MQQEKPKPVAGSDECLPWVLEAEFKSFAVREDQESFPREANRTS